MNCCETLGPKMEARRRLQKIASDLRADIDRVNEEGDFESGIPLVMEYNNAEQGLLLVEEEIWQELEREFYGQ